ncbi:hypothetical protein F4780DRAFT_270976 [Xylariomycetidae sp. FL0641]|nr:hypothetical protein F4780DRAFT_270976 [Xylariomycetidae sp. FL0641]
MAVSSSTRGKRLLPSLVDEISQSDPTRVLYSVMKSNDPKQGYYNITVKEFAQAVDRCAWYIEAELGRGSGFPTLAYIGPQDVVHAILILACIKTGYQLFLSSPRNTLDAHLQLLEELDCQVFLMPPKFPLPVIKQILAKRDMRVLGIPGAEHWLEPQPVKHYPYTKTYEEARLDPFVVLHTSGSTGMPKPVVQKHGTYTTVDAFTTLTELGYAPTYPASCAGSRVYLGFPLFHCAGVTMLLPGPIYVGFTTVLGPFPPSAESANGIHLYGDVQETCLPPPTLMEVAKDPTHLENLGRLKMATFGGGPLPQHVGDLISKRTSLLNCMGATECGVLPNQITDREDWAYMSASPLLGHEYRYVSDDLYEQVIVRKPELELYQGVFATFDELDEWPMKDLYSKHPTKDNVWLHRGRADDIIVYSTGEKLRPIEMESIITSHPAVKAALVVGAGRFQSSLLIEAVDPPESEEQERALLEDIWPSAQEANNASPSHARIHKHMVAFTKMDRPMLRAGKGTVQRKPTLDLYAAELDAIYDDGNEPSSKNQTDVNGHEESLTDAILRIVSNCTGLAVQEIDSHDNLFSLGLDSLQVTLLVREVNRMLSTKGCPKPMEPKMVYANPSLQGLMDTVTALINGKTPFEAPEKRVEKMKSLYHRYAHGLPINARGPRSRSTDDHVVLLTGSTGSLGSYILDSLVGDAKVSHIYCLNRGPESRLRQERSQASKGLREIPDRVTFLEADMTGTHLGLPLDSYKELLGSVDVVVHNAWQVDFNQSLDSFVSQIGTVRNLIDFSAHSLYGARLFFVSSIGTATNWSRIEKGSAVPEQVLEDWNMPEGLGYGESKFIAERLIDTAASEAGVPATICRVTQVAGPTTAAGMWPKREWLPSLIQSSKYLGRLPASLGRLDRIDWVPVDVLGRSVVELALVPSTEASQGGGARVFNAANHHHASWPELASTVTRRLGASQEIEVVSLPEWLGALRASVSKTEDLAQNPAATLLDFFEGLLANQDRPVILDTRRALASSRSLADLGPVHDGWMEGWLTQWGY